MPVRETASCGWAVNMRIIFYKFIYSFYQALLEHNFYENIK